MLQRLNLSLLHLKLWIFLMVCPQAHLFLVSSWCLIIWYKEKLWIAPKSHRVWFPFHIKLKVTSKAASVFSYWVMIDNLPHNQWNLLLLNLHVCQMRMQLTLQSQHSKVQPWGSHSVSRSNLENLRKLQLMLLSQIWRPLHSQILSSRLQCQR